MPSKSTFPECRVRAIQAIVELLRLLNEQWGFNQIDCTHWSTTQLSYDFYMDSDYAHPDVPGIHVHLLHILRKVWIATSAEIWGHKECQKGADGITVPRVFHFEWTEGGRIAQVVEVELQSYEEYLEWVCKTYEYNPKLWPCEQAET